MREDYRVGIECRECGRARVQTDGICEKCGWNNDLGGFGPKVPHGWIYNENTFEHQLYEKGELLFTVNALAAMYMNRSPRELYGIARGIIAP
jgi:hypothetical protein